MDTLQNGLNQSVTQLITSVTTLIGVFIMMLSINVWMTLAALVILPVSMGIIGGVMGKSQGFFRSQQKYLGEVNGQIEEVYGGHNVVKVFNKEKDVVEEFEKVNKELYNSAWKSQFFSGIMMPIMQFIGNLGYVIVAILGGFMVIKNAIEVGRYPVVLPVHPELYPADPADRAGNPICFSLQRRLLSVYLNS